MEKFIKKHWITILGSILGALAGYLYWRFVGCSSGSCPITSSPLASTTLGLLIGGLLFSSFRKTK